MALAIITSEGWDAIKTVQTKLNENLRYNSLTSLIDNNSIKFSIPRTTYETLLFMQCVS